MIADRRTIAAGLALFGLGAAVRPARAQGTDTPAVARAVEALTKAMLEADEAALRTLTAEGLSYGHSAGRIETQQQFLEPITSRRTVYKSINLSEQSISVVGDNAIVRHIFSGEVESNGTPSQVRIGVLQVWTKQTGAWRLLARQAFRL